MKGTIKSKEDMERLFKTGRRSSSSSLSIIVLENPSSNTGRCAFVAGKKLGNAPFRNRCKRLLREASHELGAPFEGYDVVFLARGSITRKKYANIIEEARSLLSKLKVIDE